MMDKILVCTDKLIWLVRNDNDTVLSYVLAFVNELTTIFDIKGL